MPNIMNNLEPRRSWLCVLVLVGGIAQLAFPQFASASSKAARALSQVTQANDNAKKSQSRTDAHADRIRELRQEIASLRAEKASLDTYVANMKTHIERQEKEMETLRSEIADVTDVGRRVQPLLARMVSALEEFVEVDRPFLLEERQERIATLKEKLEDPNIDLPSRFRAVLEAYQAEADFGTTLETYRGKLADGRAVEFLRFGRISLVYQTPDASEVGVWDPTSQDWKRMDRTYVSLLKSAFRVARKHTAPDLVAAPVYMAPGGTP